MMITNSALHHVIIKHIVDNGYAPEMDYLCDHFKCDKSEVESALLELQNYHGVVLHPDKPKVWVVHPFSLAPTIFFVKSAIGQWWGNCAWCSLGIAALLKSDVTITTTIGAEYKQIVIHIINGEIAEKNLFVHFPIPMKNAWDNVVYTCSNMLIFENENQIDNWTKRHNIPKGDVQPIAKIWEFAKKWYGNHLSPAWSKWTSEQAKNIFAEFGLNGDIWKLEDSKERF